MEEALRSVLSVDRGLLEATVCDMLDTMFKGRMRMDCKGAPVDIRPLVDLSSPGLETRVAVAEAGVGGARAGGVIQTVQAVFL